MMTGSDIRKSFLDFFREKQHTIVPSSSLLPDSPNLLFTNAGMNQFVPIFLGQQKPAWQPPRTVDTQKCIRAGGKHNDLEDVGLDTYHHTFFEMLGNWSFGDYFKKEAIDWAWELVVERWRLPAQRLYATVYKPGAGEPSEFDQEAYDHWERKFRDADLDPKIHIVNGNKKDNFWMMGDTGPCGPCSELHVDLTLDGDTRGSLVNKDDPRCIEIWNLVFIQFNANPDGTFSPLPQRHVDTGMGFERATAIIQGTKDFTDFSGVISNYETDVFRPIFDEIEKLSGKKYTSTLPGKNSQPSTLNDQLSVDIAFRVIADHIRTLTFAIGDGIIPSNEGRGYVLRRILRRAVRYGRTLGFHEPFFFKLVDVVARTMGDVFPEVRANQQRIKETIQREEDSFNKTLDRGIAFFEQAVRMVESVSHAPGHFEASEMSARTGSWKKRTKLGSVDRDTAGNVVKRISGDVAFRLYDEQGFPLDLTELMARERGFIVDVEGFDQLMDEQRTRAQAAQKKEVIEVIDTGVLNSPPTEFLGYETLEVNTKMIGSPGQKWLIVEKTPFYAEMGGQISDTGNVQSAAGTFQIRNVRKVGENVIVHWGERDFEISTGEEVRLMVDSKRRRAIERHHTVTHLLHWALHEFVSRDAVQKGSYVGPDKLTFDFSSAALTKSQVRDLEKLVNDKIAEKAPVTWTEIPYAEARQRTDIQQFFGDKYGDTVRVVQIGGDETKLNGYSMELCGGTHVRSTEDIEWFHIVREEAIAAGIRRIEAVAGSAIRDWAQQEAKKQADKFDMLNRKKSGLEGLPEFDPAAAPGKLVEQVQSRSAHLANIEAEIHEWEKQQAKSAEADLQSRASTIASQLAEACDGKASCVAQVPDADGKLLGAIADALKTKVNGPIFLAGSANGRVALLALVPKEMTPRIQANELIQETAVIVGGKGGGRPESAQGGGTDAGKIGEALRRAEEIFSA